MPENPIKFDHFLENDNYSEEIKNPKTDNKMLNAYLITLSKQIQQLSAKTEKKSEHKLENSSFPWKLYSISAGALLAMCLITIFTVNQKNHKFKIEINNQLSEHYNSMEALFTKNILEANSDAKKSYLKERTFMMNKIKEIEKNVSNNKEKLEIYEENLNNIINEAYKIKVKQIFEQQEAPKPKSNIEVPDTDSISKAASKLLDKIQKQKTNKNTSKNEIQEIDNYNNNKTALYSNAYAKMGWTYSSQGNIEKAINEYNYAIKLDHTNGMAYYNLACCYTKAKKFDKAFESLKRGRPYFNKDIIETAKYDPDLNELRNNPYFASLMFNKN